jgi:hypothetical protein
MLCSGFFLSGALSGLEKIIETEDFYHKGTKPQKSTKGLTTDFTRQKARSRHRQTD